MGTAGQISDSFVSDQVDMICAIATPAAQSAYNAAMDSEIPVIYTAVTDPVAAELADALARTAGMSCAISDRDAVIAAAGGAKKDVLEKSVSAELEQLMEQRIIYARGESSLPDIPLSGRDGYRLVTAVPVITDGDVSGCVAFISEKEDTASSEVLLGLCQSAAQFLSHRIAV